MDKSFRERVVCYIQDAHVKAFFTGEFEQYAARFRSEAVSLILNKVGAFLANPALRHILGSAENGVRFREIMDEGKVFVANLSKGRLGEDDSALVGALLLSQMERAALSRADVSPDARQDSYLFVDEFQSFATASFVAFLSESRKYGQNLTLANQFIAQLDEAVRDAVFGNVGTLISFQVGVADAEYQATSEPFSGVMLPPADVHRS